MLKKNHKNVLLNQIIIDNSSFSFKELIPVYEYSDNVQYLSKNKDGEISWLSIDNSLNIIVNNRFKDTNIYYVEGKIGVGRYPLFNYKVDIAVPRNTLMTAFHVGDGSYGFSLGNGTTSGFVPEIIGVASNNDDVGLYFVSVTAHQNDNVNNTIPLIIIDGRKKYDKAEYGKLENRPILGISNCDYYNYVVLIDNKGNIFANDLIVNNISLIKKIQELEEEINKLKNERI